MSPLGLAEQGGSPEMKCLTSATNRRPHKIRFYCEFNLLPHLATKRVPFDPKDPPQLLQASGRSVPSRCLLAGPIANFLEKIKPRTPLIFKATESSQDTLLCNASQHVTFLYVVAIS